MTSPLTKGILPEQYTFVENYRGWDIWYNTLHDTTSDYYAIATKNTVYSVLASTLELARKSIDDVITEHPDLEGTPPLGMILNVRGIFGLWSYPLVNTVLNAIRNIIYS